MPVLQAHNISYQFDDGEVLFRDLSLSLSHQRVGLVGRNGAGKSFLLSVLCRQILPSSGSITLNARAGMFRQVLPEQTTSGLTIARYLGVDKTIDAIERVQDGECDEGLFERIGEDWLLKQELESRLKTLRLPADVHFPCQSLSGGQLATLQLWRLFHSGYELLILDEPSNHLDASARYWLREQIRQFAGHILLVSHDRQLLRQMDAIWELTTLGLQQYGRNYDDYQRQKQAESSAVERQLTAVKKQQQQLEQQVQKNLEKAQQRATKGVRLRRSGSQAKIILNGMRDSATATAANRRKNSAGLRDKLQQKAQALEKRFEQLSSQKLYLTGEKGRGECLVNIVAGRLPFGSAEPVNLQLYSGTKLHLQGDNGSGKSTLLKVLQRKFDLLAGELHLNSDVCYLDQHFSLLDEQLCALDNLRTACATLTESDARTLLAGVGLRRDDVYRQAGVLSGGERMKLVMLMVANHDNQPLLLLDEPDNHLDLDAKRLLAQTLAGYPGPYILVSHDTDFVDESGINSRLNLTLPQ